MIKKNENISQRCGKSRSKDKNEHPLKRYCSDNVLSTKVKIPYPHICIQTPCTMNCEKIEKINLNL